VQASMLIATHRRDRLLVECVTRTETKWGRAPRFGWGVATVDGKGSVTVLEALSASARTRLVSGRHCTMILGDSSLSVESFLLLPQGGSRTSSGKEFG
jgi:hypothetical protein